MGLKEPAIHFEHANNWAFAHEFREDFFGDETAGSIVSVDSVDFPADANEIIEFAEKILSRRQPIVDRLSKYPTLNDHGFFLLICRIYKHSARGKGLTQKQMKKLLIQFSRNAFEERTALKKIDLAEEVHVFERKKNPTDQRSKLYFLHPDFVELISETFRGMIFDARQVSEPHSNG